MYLKRVELVGFKSFAEKTRLEFEPGMTAIVGPNGCGKSNVSDAIRWVLGETSARALRGAKMEDCIFNGTDSHKPLSMAEVSLTLAECEDKLGTDFHEVTVTRRVLRSGEGQYMINKTPCRLKDIQRLFMDTGIGTNSYSVMEQGRIDMILSARPDDRRAVFEEASGITKYKADKKEAIRKLDHTEANLLRLGDIIKEVKRQIISLQRQAGKARRYKLLEDQLRGLDVFLTREQVNELTKQIRELETQQATLNEQDEAAKTESATLEKQAADIRAELGKIEEEIAKGMDAAVQAQSERDRTRQLIQVNHDRVVEIRTLSERDSKDADEARARLAEHQKDVEANAKLLTEAEQKKKDAQKELDRSSSELTKLEKNVNETRHKLNEFRTESVDLDSKISKLQNELHDLDARERSSVLRKERLATEQAEMKRAVEQFKTRRAEMEAQLESLRAERDLWEKKVKELSDAKDAKVASIREAEKGMSEFRAQAAAKQAQCEMLRADANQTEGFPAGARMILDGKAESPKDHQHVVGALADLIHADGEYQVALEAVLRSWLDAVVVKDIDAARAVLETLRKSGEGAARLLAVDVGDADANPPAHAPGDVLLNHVEADDAVHPLLRRMLRNVFVVDSLEGITVEADWVLVTKDGALLRGAGEAEYWTRKGAESNPLSRRHLLDSRQAEYEDLLRKIDEQSGTLEQRAAELSGIDAELSESIGKRENARRQLALQEGELQVVSHGSKQANDRLETVSFELNTLVKEQSSGNNARQRLTEQNETTKKRLTEVRTLISSNTDTLQALEQQRSERLSEATDRRVHFAEARQEVERFEGRRDAFNARISELNNLVENRAAGLTNYANRIKELEKSIEESEKRIKPLEDDIEAKNAELEAIRGKREARTAALNETDGTLRTKRGQIDQMRNKKSEIEVNLAEQRMRKGNVVERVTADYRITLDDILTADEPEWENDQRPDRETLETRVAELKTKLESMGPVNLVAIEEHRELEERHAFLTHQEDDLQKAKKQLMDMIRKINQTTTELFSNTFNKVNEYFQEIFKQMFGGGNAKLVMVDEEDVLESGIEIIARPPGKKLQSVSLLSGGERTMTAVALLFSLYSVKPSPFCVLDELDAALDDANIGRFVTMLQGFINQSQFVIITHNRQTIEAADVLYGVTMQTRGVSKIVSVKLNEHSEEEARLLQDVDKDKKKKEKEKEKEPQPTT